MTIYAFDVDHTLDISEGPVHLDEVARFGSAPAVVVGLCGNWGLVTRLVPGWHRIFSFVGPIGIPKAQMLEQLRLHCPADEYVMVGNDPRIFGNSDDVGAAAEAEWRFIREHDFARGMR